MSFFFCNRLRRDHTQFREFVDAVTWRANAVKLRAPDHIRTPQCCTPCWLSSALHSVRCRLVCECLDMCTTNDPHETVNAQICARRALANERLEDTWWDTRMDVTTSSDSSSSRTSQELTHASEEGFAQMCVDWFCQSNRGADLSGQLRGRPHSAMMATGRCAEEKLSYIARAATELKSTAEGLDKKKTYELSDGNIISVGDDRFRCPEVSLQPRFISVEASGIQDMSLLSDVDIRKDLFADVVMYHHDSRERRTRDGGVECVGTTNDVFKVVSPPVRRSSVRIGGSVLSALRTFQQIVISKGEYNESDVPRAHDADHVRDVQRAHHVRGDPGLTRAHDADLVRDVQRAHHVRGDPGCFVSARFETHDGYRDER